jgi:hypothetical protein
MIPNFGSGGFSAVCLLQALKKMTSLHRIDAGTKNKRKLWRLHKIINLRKFWYPIFIRPTKIDRKKLCTIFQMTESLEA